VEVVIPFFIEDSLAPFMFLLDPQKRVYWLYLASSAMVLLAINLAARNKIKHLKIKLLTKSSAVDLCWLVVNQCLLKLWIAPFFALQINAVIWLNSLLISVFGNGDFFKLDVLSITLLFTFVLFVVDDFGKFIVHLSFHRIAFLWPFHAVHHSATNLTPLTLYRIHPVELVINSLRSFCVAVLVSSAFVYLFANQISVVQIIGVNLFIFLFNIAASNLRHSPFYLGFGRLERLFISPAQHQIHHSAAVQHFDKNFGSALAIWDRLFNSLLLSKTESVSDFGLDNKGGDQQTFKQQWWGIRK